MRNKLRFLFFCILIVITIKSQGQELFVNKIWIGLYAKHEQSNDEFNGFAIYFFRPDGILETQTTQIDKQYEKYIWHKNPFSRKIHIQNQSNTETFTFCIKKCTENFMILKMNNIEYTFSNMELIDTKEFSIATMEKTVTLNHFFDVSDTSKITIFNPDHTISYITTNKKMFLSPEPLNWDIAAFRDSYFLIIRPGIIVYQIILQNGMLILKSLHINNIDMFTYIKGK